MIRSGFVGAAALLMMAVTACDTVPLEDTPTRAQIADSTLPPMKAFATPHPQAPTRSNSNIAADFLDLHFKLESGRPLPMLTRFETPITVKVGGSPPPNLVQDLTRLLTRLRNEAGIDITQIRQGDANIAIQAVSRDDIRRALPDAACFVIPNVTDLTKFRKSRRNPKTNWSLLRERTRLGVFVPYDVSPQELRDCLHEELAQAIGPLNDLYRLPDSVFNDDNVHTVLTGFDMLILRATYAPELHSGMTRSEVAARLPAILERLNPDGADIPAHPLEETPREWVDAVQTALGPGTDPEGRWRAANQAAALAQTRGWQDHRRAYNHRILGQLSIKQDPELAAQHFQTSLHFLSDGLATDLHRAYVATHLAAYSLSRGDGEAALYRVQKYLDIAGQSENAALLSTLMLLQAEALDMIGSRSQADAVRLDSLGWARYGFGLGSGDAGQDAGRLGLHPTR